MSLVGLLLSMASQVCAELIGPALAGEPRAVDALIARLTPVIRAGVRQALRRWQSSRRLGPYDGDDLAQEVWLLLLKNDGQRLRDYDPSRGGSLESYVRLVARTEGGQLLRREQALKRGGGAVHDDLEEARAIGSGLDPEAVTIGRDLAARIREELFRRLSEKGQLVYAHVYEDGRAPAEAARLMNVTTQVIYNWQNKIRGIIRELAPI